MLQRDFLRVRRNSTSGEIFSSNENHSPTSTKSKRPSSSRPLSALSGLPYSVVTTTTGRPPSGAPQPPRSPCSSSWGRQASSSSTGFSGMSPSSPALSSQGGNETVRVAVRCRPLSSRELEYSGEVVVAMDPTNATVSIAGVEAPFSVDVPLWSGAAPAQDGSAPVSQAAVYEQVGRPLLMHAMDGYNSTLLAYGQTGSGKTYTMLGGGKGWGEQIGDPEDGIIPRMCMELFDELRDRTFVATTGEKLSWEVYVRYVEVYCEKVSDLLNVGAAVSVREEVTPSSATFALVGARRIRVESKEDLLQAFAIGNRCRRTAVTKSNERSSRSHTIFMIELCENISFEEPDGTVATATNRHFCIRLVDLAGSERVSETGVQGQQLKEAREINKSLFTLGMVIEQLSDHKRKGIKPPYRNSVLTKLLRDAFGGNSKTTLICTIDPCEKHRPQTIQTLNYAAKARHVLNKPKVEEDPAAIELRRANEELMQLRRELSEAQRTGARKEAIEAQLKEVNDRLRREQECTLQRRLAMEKREADLVARLRAMEEERSAYEAQMAALESEALQAKSLQKEREKQLTEAQRKAEQDAQERLSEMQEQRRTSEVALKNKEDDLLKQQREMEAKLYDLETKSRERVHDLKCRQKDLEKELHQKEKLAQAQEKELRRKFESAQQEAVALEQRTVTMEEEWVARVRELEAAAQEREREVATRMREAQERLRDAEEETRKTESAMQRKWAEAESQAARLQAEAETRQAELDRRMLELARKAQDKEDEMNDKLRKAEFQLRSKEREARQHEEEVASLKRAKIREDSETSRSLKAFGDSLAVREAQLKDRERDLDAQFAEILQRRSEWEQKQAVRETELQRTHEDTLQKLKGREAVLLEKERFARQSQDALNSRQHQMEMELKRKELELLAHTREMEGELQNGRNANVRAKEEFQRTIARFEAESKLLEERLQSWEDDLQGRRAELEADHAKRAEELAKRERGVNLAEEVTRARNEELAHALADAALVESRRQQEHADVMARLKKKEEESESLRSSLQLREGETLSHQKYLKDTEAIRGAQAKAAARALFTRELEYVIGIEAIYRACIVREESATALLLLREGRLGSHEVTRQLEAAAQTGRVHAMELQLREKEDELRRQQTRAGEWEQQVKTLLKELDQRQQDLLETKVQLGTVAASAQFAEESLERAKRQLRETEEVHRTAQQESKARQDSAYMGLEAEAQKATRIARGAAFALFDFEEMHRSQIEEHLHHEFMMLKMLEMAEHKARDRTVACDRWQAVCRERNLCPTPRSSTSQGSGSNGTYRGLSPSLSLSQGLIFDRESGALFNVASQEQELRKREGQLLADQEAFAQRVAEFAAEQRRGEERLRAEEEHVKRYLLEIEEIDRARVAEYNAREKELIEQATRLKTKESALASRMHGVSEVFAVESEQQNTHFKAVSAELKKDSEDHVREMRIDLDLLRCAVKGDNASLVELLQRTEASLKAESARLENRVRRIEEEDRQRVTRRSAEEAEIKQYLIFLEQEDIRVSVLSEQGQRALKETQEQLEAARRREQDMRDMARRLKLETMNMEKESRLLETDLRRRERAMRKSMRDRKAALDRRKKEMDTVVDDNERTLLGLEDDLRNIITRNKDAERMIKARDEEIKRQKNYHLDLSKLLEERERLLRLEHAHRMDGKHSATCLAGDLLDHNDELRKQLTGLLRKFSVLAWSGKIECEQCMWLNKTDAKACRCCGHPIGVEKPDNTAGSLPPPTSLCSPVI